jgi:hypothetical protein
MRLEWSEAKGVGFSLSHLQQQQQQQQLGLLTWSLLGTEAGSSFFISSFLQVT